MTVLHSPTQNEENLMFAYKTLFNDTMTYYFGKEHSFSYENNIEVNTTAIEATAIDEYLVYLINGYINVTLVERLEKYFLELIKDKWFHQWPLVRWAYATRLIYNPKTSEKNIKRAVEILLPLAEEGYPCAVGDLAYCYRYGLGVELSYEKAICLWEMASRKGYCKARECLKMEYDMRCSKELPEELRLFLVHRVLWMFIEDHNLPVVNYIIYPDGLSADATKVLSRIFNEHKRLRKSVQEKSYLRHCGQLCWSDEDNPYSIGIKIK